jgi:hypothetical protein
MKRSERKNVKTDSKQPHPDPHKDSREQNECHVSGDIHVRGEVESKLPPSLIEKYDTERKDDNTREGKRFVINFVLQLLTLIALIVYAGLAAWQGWSAQKTADSTVIDRRPYVVVKDPDFSRHTGILVENERLLAAVTVIDIGRTPAISTYDTVALLDFPPPKPNGKHGIEAQKTFVDDAFRRLADKERNARAVLMPLSAEHDIAPGGDYFAITPESITLTQPEIDDIYSNDKNPGALFFVGVITYTDAEDAAKHPYRTEQHPYRTEFCWFFLGRDQSEKGPSVWRRCNFHNINR